MQNKPKRAGWRPGSGCVIALIVVLALASISVGGYFWARTYFAHQYYNALYEAVWLKDAPLPAAAAESHHLDDVPWLASARPLGPALSLQMMAQQLGLDVSRREIDFLMGYTYGATSMDGQVSFFPGVDPDLGLITAAPCLGLARHYRVSNDAEAYRAALRGALWQGQAVRVALDLAELYDLDAPRSHSLVLVGYDAAGWYAYEPVCDGLAACQPGEQRPGTPGLYLSDEALLRAVRSQARLMRYPWRYNMLTLEPDPLATCDLPRLWQRNGQTLQGGDRYGQIQGADVIERVAQVLIQRGTRVDQAALAQSLAMAAFARHENAAYLAETWPSEPAAVEAAEHLLQAAARYERCLAALEDGLADNNEARSLASLLLQAAQFERQAGQALSDQGRR